MPIWIPQLHGIVTFEGTDYRVTLGWSDSWHAWYRIEHGAQACGYKVCGEATVNDQFVAYSHLRAVDRGAGTYLWLINVGPTINEWFGYHSWDEAATDVVRLHLGHSGAVQQAC